jgi:hypothetical protein
MERGAILAVALCQQLLAGIAVPVCRAWKMRDFYPSLVGEYPFFLQLPPVIQRCVQPQALNRQIQKCPHTLRCLSALAVHHMNG